MTLHIDGESVTKPEEELLSQGDEQDDALWNEVASERNDPPADDAAGVSEDPTDPSEAVDAKSGSDEDSDENKEAAGANSDPPASQASSDDIWANAPPELKAAHEAEVARFETKFKSVTGRLSVQDRLLDALRKGNGSKAQAILDSGDFKTLKEEYGDNLKPLVSAVESLVERQGQIDEAVGQADEARGNAHVDEQLDLYAQAHPDWESFGTDNHFAPWLERQPRHIREAAGRNSHVIVDAAEASDVLTRFKAYKASLAPAPDPEPTRDSQGGERRDRQRHGGRASEVRGGSSVTVTDPDDPDALWDQIARKRDQQRR